MARHLKKGDIVRIQMKGNPYYGRKGLVDIPKGGKGTNDYSKMAMIRVYRRTGLDRLPIMYEHKDLVRLRRKR